MKTKKKQPTKSTELSREEVRYLREVCSYYDTPTAAAIELKVSRDVLLNTIARKSCSPATYNKLFNQKNIEPCKQSV